MKNKGFTLIELLAVIVILGILLSITVVSVNNIRKKQEEKNRLNVISSILTGAKEYNVEHKISSAGVSVKTLKDNDYADFDEEKYSDLYKDDVMIYKESCEDELGFKLKYSIQVEGKNYNDCGCEEQKSDTISKTICEE